MQQLNDCKRKSLTTLGFTGNISDMELAWLKSVLAAGIPTELISQPFDFQDANWVGIDSGTIQTSTDLDVPGVNPLSGARHNPPFFGNSSVTYDVNVNAAIAAGTGSFRVALFKGNSLIDSLQFNITTTPADFMGTLTAAAMGTDYRIRIIDETPVTGPKTIIVNSLSVTTPLPSLTDPDQINDAWRLLTLMFGRQFNDGRIAWMKMQGAVGDHINDVMFDFWCNVIITTADWDSAVDSSAWVDTDDWEG